MIVGNDGHVINAIEQVAGAPREWAKLKEQPKELAACQVKNCEHRCEAAPTKPFVPSARVRAPGQSE